MWWHFRRRAPSGILADLAVFAAAVAYFSWQLTAHEISGLEAQDLAIARALSSTYALSPDHSPLHFIFLWAWDGLCTTSVAFLRGPSVLFAAVTAVVVARLAEAVGGRRVRWLSSIFFITNPEVVDAARSMRLYSLSILLAALCLFFAHRYWKTWRMRSLTWLLVVSVLAIYNHMFAWLYVVPIAVVLAIARAKTRPPDHRRQRRRIIVAGVVLLPQVFHGFVALGFTQERHALHPGLSKGPGFVVSVARALLLGESPVTSEWSALLLVVPAVVLVLGLVELRGKARPLAAIYLPAIVATWVLSRSSQVEARYLSFLTPAMAIVMGMALGRATRALGPAALRAALGVAALLLSLYATREAYRLVPSDWADGIARLNALRQPADIVAVFPDLWGATFERYGGAPDYEPIAFPSDLDHVLAHRRRILLITNPARELGNLEAFMKANAHYSLLFRTSVRQTLAVYSVVANGEAPLPVRAAPPSLMFGGLIGSGGYPWQGKPASDADPFAGLRGLFGASAAVFAGYDAYHPRWYARPLLGSDRVHQLEPNAAVGRALVAGGVHVLVPVARSPTDDGSAPTLPEGPPLLESIANGRPLDVRRYELGGVSVGVVSLTRASADGTTNPGDDDAIRQARHSLGASGHLVAVVPASPDYGGLATAAERRYAHHLVDLGVEAVVGIGGYAAKEVEEYANGVVAYSLGTLLRPSTLMANRDATGILLRVGFSAGGVRYDVVPLALDPARGPEIGRARTSARLEHRVDDATGSSLADRVASATAAYVDTDGTRHDFGPWRSDAITKITPFEQSFLTGVAPLTAWFPLTVMNSPCRPFDGAFVASSAAISRRGTPSMGEYRRVLELDPGSKRSVSVRFPDLPDGDRLDVTFGLPDDRLRSKFAPLFDQRLIVSLDDRVLATSPIRYVLGWTTLPIALPPADRRDVTISVETNGTRFPVAIDARVVRSSPVAR